MAEKVIELEDIYSRDYVLKMDENGCYELLEKEYGGDLASVDWGESGRDLAKYFEEWPEVDFEEIYRRLESANKEFAAEFKEIQKRIEEERRLPGCYLGEFEILSGSGYWRSQYSIEGNPDGSFTIYGLCLEPGYVDRFEWVIHSAKELVSYGEERGMDFEVVYKKLLDYDDPLARNLLAELCKKYPDKFSGCELEMMNRPLEGQLELPFKNVDSRDGLALELPGDSGQETTTGSETPVQRQLVSEEEKIKQEGVSEESNKVVHLSAWKTKKYFEKHMPMRFYCQFPDERNEEDDSE